jgi:hypothetical protein
MAMPGISTGNVQAGALAVPPQPGIRESYLGEESKGSQGSQPNAHVACPLNLHGNQG